MDRDTPDVQYVGEWWLPSSSEKKTRGTLLIRAGDWATLSLEPGESLGPIPDGGSPIEREFSFCLRKTYDVVLGEAYEIVADDRQHQRRHLTLGNCYVESVLSSLDTPASYSVGVVVAGDLHIPSLCFNELSFDIPNLGEAFPGCSPFNTSYYPDPGLCKGGLTFAVHGVVQRWLVRSGVSGRSGRSGRQPDTEIRFERDIEMGHPPSCTTSLTDRYRLTLRFRSRKSKWSIQMAEWFWEELSQFLWLVTGLRPACQGITATVNDSSPPMIFRVFSHRLVDQAAFSNNLSFERSPLFRVTELPSHDISFLWTYWDFLYLRLSDVLLLRGIARQLSDAGLFDQALLLDVAALESLHQVWTPPGSRSQGRVGKKNPKTGNIALPPYVARLAREYAPQLTSHAPQLSLAISDYRNYVAHHGAEAKKRYQAWPEALMEVVPRFCEFLLDMTLLDFVGRQDWRYYPRIGDQTRMAKKHAAHWEHVRLVQYVAAELDKWRAKPSTTG